MFGKEPDKHGGQDNHQEPSDAVRNLQLQLEVLPHTHVPIVLEWALIRSLFHPGDVTPWRHVGIWEQAGGDAGAEALDTTRSVVHGDVAPLVAGDSQGGALTDGKLRTLRP